MNNCMTGVHIYIYCTYTTGEFSMHPYMKRAPSSFDVIAQRIDMYDRVCYQLMVAGHNTDDDEHDSTPLHDDGQNDHYRDVHGQVGNDWIYAAMQHCAAYD